MEIYFPLFWRLGSLRRPDSWLIDCTFSLCSHMMKETTWLSGISFVRKWIRKGRDCQITSDKSYCLILSHWWLDFNTWTFQAMSVSICLWLLFLLGKSAPLLIYMIFISCNSFSLNSVLSFISIVTKALFVTVCMKCLCLSFHFQRLLFLGLKWVLASANNWVIFKKKPILNFAFWLEYFIYIWKHYWKRRTYFCHFAVCFLFTLGIFAQSLHCNLPFIWPFIVYHLGCFFIFLYILVLFLVVTMRIAISILHL